MKVLWLSRHKPTQRQMDELKRLFGPTVVEWDNRPFDGANSIVERFKRTKADEMVLVAPLTVFRELVKRGIHPLYGTMEQVPCNDHKQVEVRIGTGRRRRCFKFINFQRVVELQFKFEQIKAKENKDV